MKKIVGIYGIGVNGVLRYIGSTKDFYKRKSCHLAKLRKNNHGNKKLQEAYNQFGEGNFSFAIIEECLVKDLYRLERKYINRFPHLYNKNEPSIKDKKVRRGKAAVNYREKRSEITSGNNNGNCKTDIETVIQIKEMIKEGYTNKEIAKTVNKSDTYISRIRVGDRWSSIVV